MRRFVVAGVTVALLAVASACDGDRPVGNTNPDSPTSLGTDATACLTYSQLQALAKTLFGQNTADGTFALNKLFTIKGHLADGRLAQAQSTALNFIGFVVERVKQNKILGTEDDATAFINGIFCFVGLPIASDEPSAAAVILPSSGPTTIAADAGDAAITIPANAVTEATYIEVVVHPDTFANPGTGPLSTRLDQYSGFITVSHSSANNTALTQPMLVEVCPDPNIPAEVLQRLRLGTDGSNGFGLTPAASSGTLHCPTSGTGGGRQGASLRASQQTGFSGGVGGTAGEFGAFAPVDPKVSLSGGVGGTAGEYIRRALMGNLFFGCTGTSIEAPVGTPVDPACLPFVGFTTQLGTLLTGIPVTWNVTAGGGLVAPRNFGVCGSFGSSAATASSAFGKTGVCWTLGAAGTNTIVATPAIGGDAIPGVVFSPTTFTFDANANPAANLNVAQGPASVITAGTPFTVSVVVVDQYGNQVMGSGAPVTLTLNKNTFAGGGNAVTVNAVNGLATFSGLQINTPGTGYTLTATGAGISAHPTTGTFSVALSSTNYTLAIVQGNNQSAFSGKFVAVDPTVKVTDQFGNPVANVAIDWRTTLGARGSVSQSPTVTNAQGIASTSWKVGEGANELTASIVGAPSVSVVFTATGIRQ